MKREIFKYRRGDCGCCPGHDLFPNDTYKNRRSKSARSRDKKIEHQFVRTLEKREVRDLIEENYEVELYEQSA